MVHRIECSEIWGGIRGDELDAESSGVRASLFSRACDGGKGGDIYYLSVCSSGLLTRPAIVDVVGHGERVSHTSRWLYESLEFHMNSGDGTQILHDLNRAVSEHGYEAMATAAIAAFCREDQNLYFSYAGHHAILANRNRRSNWEALTGSAHDGLSGLPLGIHDDTEYVQRHVPVEAGDRLFLYTDGIVEAPNQAGENYGVQRLIQVLNSTSGADLAVIRSSVLDSLFEHTDGEMGHDDITFMAVEIRG